MTLGILYPRSAVYPDMGVDFIDGIKSFIKSNLACSSIQLQLEGIGFGGAEKEVYDKAEKLLRFDKVDILIAFIDLRVLPIIEPLAYSLDKLLLVVNAGANYPYNWVPQPNVIFLGLQHAFLCWMTGMEAAKAGNAALATSFYDCGYLHSTAIVNGLVQHGGNIMHNFVYNKAYDAFDITPLSDFLAANQYTNILLCVYDTIPAAIFYNKLKSFDGAKSLRLFVSPMMLENKALDELQIDAPFKVTGYMSWDSLAEDDANKLFRYEYERFAKKLPNIFSLLGWEAGLVIGQIMKQEDYATFDGNIITEQLKEVVFDGPRGATCLDSETHYFLTPAIRCTVENNEVLIHTEPTEMLKQYWSTFTAQPAEVLSSGWTNTYLCY